MQIPGEPIGLFLRPPDLRPWKTEAPGSFVDERDIQGFSGYPKPKPRKAIVSAHSSPPSESTSKRHQKRCQQASVDEVEMRQAELNYT